MKRIKRRAYCVLLVVAALLLGMSVYCVRFAVHGSEWVSFSSGGVGSGAETRISGRLTDRYGVLLADSVDGKRVLSTDAATRIACLHLTGDPAGNIGTGALLHFSDRLTRYSPVTGLALGGNTLTLSADAALCRLAYAALDGRKGAVLLCDYTTGEILCMVSSMSYDPETGFDLSDPAYAGAYLNRALSGAYTPGSVFKLVTVAAAIETMPDLRERRFSCTGSVTVDGNEVHCTGVHGEQTVEQALANSCNCAFAALSLELGGDVLATYADKYGFTSRQSLSGIPTAAGNYDAAPDGSAALAWSGIGQSTDQVNPYAMLRFVSAIGNGGVLAEPTLLAGKSGGSTRLLLPDTAARLKAMMNYNVVYAYGAWQFPGLTLCAKSGTAEVGDGTSHAWFTGFLDDPAHPYAFVVVIENAGGGLRNAGPVANTLLQAAIAEHDNGENEHD